MVEFDELQTLLHQNDSALRKLVDSAPKADRDAVEETTKKHDHNGSCVTGPSTASS